MCEINYNRTCCAESGACPMPRPHLETAHKTVCKTQYWKHVYLLLCVLAMTEEDAAFANALHSVMLHTQQRVVNRTVLQEEYYYGHNFLSYLGLAYGGGFKNFTTPDFCSEFFETFHCILLSQETLFGPKYTLSHTYSVQKVHTKPYVSKVFRFYRKFVLHFPFEGETNKLHYILSPEISVLYENSYVNCMCDTSNVRNAADATSRWGVDDTSIPHGTRCYATVHTLAVSSR